MDGQKFDKLTRAFATGTDRRSLLKIFGGATLAGVAGVTVARTQSVAAQAGNPCVTGAPNPCGDNTFVCCPPNQDDPPGTAGVCTSGMTGCQYPVECSALQTSCEETECCAEDTECGANGWCNACYSGTADPCGGINEAFGADYICCTYGDTTPGAIGWCMAESDCVVAPPNTGAGTSAGSSTWIAPAAAIGAAAAVMAYKSREKNAETEV